MITLMTGAAAVAGVYAGVSYIQRIGKKGDISENPWGLMKSSNRN